MYGAWAAWAQVSTGTRRQNVHVVTSRGRRVAQRPPALPAALADRDARRHAAPAVRGLAARAGPHSARGGAARAGRRRAVDRRGAGAGRALEPARALERSRLRRPAALGVGSPG